MKIVVLTFTHNENFGSCFQCYALTKYLMDRGHSVTQLLVPHVHQKKKSFRDHIIHVFQAIGYKFRQVIMGKKSVQSNVAGAATNPDYIRYPMTEEERKGMKKYKRERIKLFDKFYDDYLPFFTKPCFTEQDILSLGLDADLYIVGSDQVWNPWITKSQKQIFFFSFVPENVKRISYAGCFGGSEEWHESEEDTRQIRSLLQKFDGIGVRSIISKNILNNVFGIASELVLDPSFLLDAVDYQKIADKSDLNSSGCLYMNKFVINDRWLEAFRGFANRRGFKLTANGEYLHLKGVKYEPLLSVEGWLRKISTSDFIITDSFHCTVFCIIFKKQFITTPSYPKGEGRMISFLEELGLRDRYFGSSDDFVKNNQRCDVQIDYEKVYSILAEKKMISKKFLNSFLN